MKLSKRYVPAALCFLVVCSSCRSGDAQSVKRAPVPPLSTVLVDPEHLIAINADRTVTQYSTDDSELKDPFNVPGVMNARGIAHVVNEIDSRTYTIALLKDGGLALWEDPHQPKVFSASEVRSAAGGPSIASVKDNLFFMSDGTVDDVLVELLLLQSQAQGAALIKSRTGDRKALNGRQVIDGCEGIARYVLLEDGNLYWDHSYADPQAIPFLKDVVAVTKSSYDLNTRNAAIRKDGTVWSWYLATGALPGSPTQLKGVGRVKVARMNSSVAWFVTGEGRAIRAPQQSIEELEDAGVGDIVSIEVDQTTNAPIALLLKSDGSLLWWDADEKVPLRGISWVPPR